MIEMKMTDEEKIDLVGFDHVDERESVHSGKT